jgi:hypothetical protein
MRTMSMHPDQGVLQAHVDGELSAVAREELSRHLDACPLCRAEVIELEALAGRVRSELLHVHAPAPDLGAARWLVRGRRIERAKERRSRIAVAASVLLLVTAGAASALPGSPFRIWWEGVRRTDVAVPTPMVEIDATVSALVQAETSGVGVPAVGGRVEIWLEQVPTGALLEIAIVDAERAFIEAPAGTEFSVEAAVGTARAIVGPRPGAIHVTVPRDAAASEVRANGILVYPPSRISAGEPSAGESGELSAIGADTLRIRIPEATPTGDPGTDSVGGG